MGKPPAAGLARAAGAPAHPLPIDAPTLLEHAAADTLTQLIVLGDLLDAVHYEKRRAYRSALGGLEARWFAPLRAALAAGRISRLRIEAPTAYATLAWDSTRREQWALRRRAQPLAALARALASGA